MIVLPRKRDLLYFSSGFCLALLLLLVHPYLAPRSSPSAPIRPASDSSELVEVPSRPSISVGSGLLADTSPPLQPEIAIAPLDTQLSSQPRPVAATPPQREHLAGQERGIQVPYAPSIENEQEVMRSFVQESLQRKIDEDENLRATLYEAAKAYLEKRREEQR